jgi:hypothetical protein
METSLFIRPFGQLMQDVDAIASWYFPYSHVKQYAESGFDE